jgi:hypothetical protein
MGNILASILAFCFFLGSAAWAEDLDRHIRIHNNSSKRIVELYAAPIDYDVKSDGNMIHGPRDFIPVGTVKVADINDNSGYCIFNLLAVLADGRIAETYGMNVCEKTDWYIHD